MGELHTHDLQQTIYIITHKQMSSKSSGNATLQVTPAWTKPSFLAK